jgi:hypothetical protein
LREAVEGIEGPGFSVFEDDARPRHPVGALAYDKVADNVECAPGVISFVGMSPDVGETAQQRIESCGSSGEKGDGVGEVELRRTRCVYGCHAYIDTWVTAGTQAATFRG